MALTRTAPALHRADHVADARLDLPAPAAAVEDAEVADALLDVVPLQVGRDVGAEILRRHAPKVLRQLGRTDPLLEIAKELEEAALCDDYFVSRHLYPNVDFYSGILLRAIGIPINMYTVMFAIGRMPGWIAHWKEVRDSGSRIYRPRQVYTGPACRDYVPIESR